MAEQEKISPLTASRDSVKREHYAPIKHNKQRRKRGHDYTSVSLYLITVTTVGRQRILGQLVGNSADEAHVEATELGRKVIAYFNRIPEITMEKTGCRVQMVQYQLMPDHFHGILYVRDELPKEWPLGQIIAGWKGVCTRAYRETFALSREAENGLRKCEAGDGVRKCEAENGLRKCEAGDGVRKCEAGDGVRDSLFNAGYNDRVLNQFGQLEGWIQYLRDNPRRLWLKLHNADRLRKVYEFEAGRLGHRYTAVGETFLVKYPERAQVRCHRNLSDEEIQREVAYYLGLARQGVVLVSPFISPAEKAVYEACYKEKLRMIRIVNRALDGQFVYPTGRDLQGCSDGFLLVLAPYMENSDETRAVRISRATCLDMNGYAADLAAFALSREAGREINEL